MYNPAIQYRATIIRGKATSELDNLLPTYAKIIDELCPCEKEKFKVEFNKQLYTILKNPTQKTLDNHRTEIAGKLFGMFYEEDGTIFVSERAEKFLEDSDQPAFFKDICFKFQFPNGMDKVSTIEDRTKNNLSLRQFPYILQCLLLGEQKKCYLTKNDIGYYILNSLQVLKGEIAPEKVIETIINDRKNNIFRNIKSHGRASSYYNQHINEQINLLEVANLVRVSKKYVYLNASEMEDIKYISSFWEEDPEFNVYEYDLTLSGERLKIIKDWQYYFSSVNISTRFKTSMSSLNISAETSKDVEVDRIKLGDDGEEFILAFEKGKVKRYDPSLVRKVVHLGKTRGIGYDIQSVIGEGEFAEFVKYIEVKATKRVTFPDIEKPDWLDTINLTRNEWIAAAQHKKSYNIYRVYFTPGKAIIFIINDPYTKNEEKKLNVKPIMYRLNFNRDSIDDVKYKEREEI